MSLHFFHYHRFAGGEHLPGDAHARRVFIMAGPGRSVGQTKPEQTGFRFKKHQMSAQKIVPGGEHTQ